MSTDPARIAREMVDAIFEDLRDRRFLKYLFAAEPEARGAYGYIESPLDRTVQTEIAEAWQRIIAQRLSPADDGLERLIHDEIEDVFMASLESGIGMVRVWQMLREIPRNVRAKLERNGDG